MGNLITNIENEFKVYCTGITVGVKIASINPSIAFIDKQYIKKELGKEQYDELLAAYEDNDMSAAQTALWKEVAAALCPLAAWHFAGANSTQLSDSGQRETTSDEATSARLWASNLQRDTWFNTGMTAIDNLLSFLDENKDDYPLWVAGTGYAGLKSNILQTTEQLNTYVHINESRRFFKMLKPSVRQVEFLNIQPAISKAFYDRLIAGLKAGDLTDEEQSAVDLLIPAIAYMAISEAKFPVQIDSNGVYKSSTSTYASGKAADESAVDESVLSDYMRQNYAIGKRYLNEALDYMNKTATDSILSQYYASSLYEAPDNSDYGDRKDNNSSLDCVFGM